MDPSNYRDKEQAYVKHFVLSNYLERLAFKIGHFKPGTTLNYVDGFSGPWNTNPQLEDSSPHVSLTVLGKARNALATSGTDFTIRAMFVERDKSAFKKLEELCTKFQNTETVLRNGDFESFIDDAAKFASTGEKPFAFVFIDPTGWTGYGMKAITPLLKVDPAEVLINFMTKDIIRFVDDDNPGTVASFIDLFGDSNYREAWRGKQGLDREDAIVNAYCERVRQAGRFRHVASTIVLNPDSDRTHYHLVYATRSPAGLVVFRETEAKALKEQRALRAETKRRKKDTGQELLFSQQLIDEGQRDMTALLQERYHALAKKRLEQLLQDGKPLGYDTALASTLEVPMFSESDLKTLIRTKTSRIEVLNLRGAEKVPKRGHNHQLRRKT